jgi:catechol 2,3-dioxygenase-like lactoylglutathione lyase family enzyme
MDRTTDGGLAGLRFGLADVASVLARVSGAGGSVTRLHHGDPTGPRDVTVIRDPDGTRIELEELADAGASPMYCGVRVNCADLERSLAFLTGGFGLVADPPRPVSVDDPDGRESGRLRVATVSVPGQADRFSLELTQWEEPAAMGSPPTTGNHAGIYRVAAVVRDIAESHACVLDVLPTAVAPVEVTVFDDEPPLLASFYPDPDGAIVELIQPAASRAMP